MNPSIRTAYERGRWRDATRDATVVIAAMLAILLATGAGTVQIGLAMTAGAAFAVLRWRGLDWGRGALLGAVAGLAPLLAPFVLAVAGLGCTGPGCPGWCSALCSSGGLVAGLAVGALARTRTALVAGGLVALLAGLAGCWPMSVTTIIGMVAALLAGEAAAGMVRRVATA